MNSYKKGVFLALFLCYDIYGDTMKNKIIIVILAIFVFLLIRPTFTIKNYKGYIYMNIKRLI